MALFTFDFTTVDWKVIIGALALLVSVFAIAYFQWWRNRKRLSYEILSNVLLVSAEKEIRDKVEIRYEGLPVTNVRLIVVKLINDGYLPIKRDDFEKSVKFIFPGAKILTAEKVKFHPENIATMLNYRDDWLEVDPALFNRKDYVKFKVLLGGYHDEMTIDARIVGVSAVGKSKRLSKDLGHHAWLLGLVVVAFASELVFTRIPFGRNYLTIAVVTAALILMVTVRHLVLRDPDDES